MFCLCLGIDYRLELTNVLVNMLGYTVWSEYVYLIMLICEIYSVAFIIVGLFCSRGPGGQNTGLSWTTAWSCHPFAAPATRSPSRKAAESLPELCFSGVYVRLLLRYSWWNVMCVCPSDAARCGVTSGHVNPNPVAQQLPESGACQKWVALIEKLALIWPPGQRSCM